MQPTKQELLEQRNKSVAEGDNLHEALSAVMAGEAELVGQFTLDGQTVKARLVNPLRAHGGLILYTDTCGSQSPMHRVRTHRGCGNQFLGL
jgi:hypothetical protein